MLCHSVTYIVFVCDSDTFFFFLVQFSYEKFTTLNGLFLLFNIPLWYFYIKSLQTNPGFLPQNTSGYDLVLKQVGEISNYIYFGECRVSCVVCRVSCVMSCVMCKRIHLFLCLFSSMITYLHEQTWCACVCVCISNCVFVWLYMSMFVALCEYACV